MVWWYGGGDDGGDDDGTRLEFRRNPRRGFKVQNFVGRSSGRSEESWSSRTLELQDSRSGSEFQFALNVCALKMNLNKLRNNRGKRHYMYT